MRVEGFPDVSQFYYNKKQCNYSHSCTQIRITLNSIGAIKTLDQDEKQLQEVVR